MRCSSETSTVKRSVVKNRSYEDRIRTIYWASQIVGWGAFSELGLTTAIMDNGLGPHGSVFPSRLVSNSVHTNYPPSFGEQTMEQRRLGNGGLRVWLSAAAA